MNLKILYITLGILSTELLAAQNQTMEMSLEQVVKIARHWNHPNARLHDIAFVRLTGTTNIIGLTICHLWVCHLILI